MKRIAFVFAASALSTAHIAEAATPCLTSPEAEAVTAAALPEVLKQTGANCARVLPATSPLRQANSPLIVRYQAAADAAWPRAKAALLKLSNPELEPLLQSEFARPLLASLIAPLVVGQVQPADCPTIGRLVSLLAPLPPANTAAVIVTSLKYFRSKQGQRRTGMANAPALPICSDES